MKLHTSVIALALLASVNLQAQTPNISSPMNKQQPQDIMQNPSADLNTVRSNYSALDTITKIKEAVTQKGMKIFTVIDHQAAAKEAGLAMPFASVVIFGMPKVGTPMMIESPTLAIDLPLKALVWENQQGEIFVSLNNPQIFQEKHHVKEENIKKLAGATQLISKAVTQ